MIAANAAPQATGASKPSAPSNSAYSMTARLSPTARTPNTRPLVGGNFSTYPDCVLSDWLPFGRFVSRFISSSPFG